MENDNKALNMVALHVGKTAIIAAIYFLGSLIGGCFGLNGRSIPIIWPQSGIALATVLLLGYSSLPGLFLGAIITALAADVSILFALINSIGNIVAVFFSAYFILQQKQFTKRLDNYQSVFSLIAFGIIIGPFISAAISIIGMYFLKMSPIESLPIIWGERWLRSAQGVLIFTPVLLIWLGNPLPKFKMNATIEGIAIFMAITGLGLFLFFGEVPYQAVYPVSFLVIPLIIWASIRNSVHGSSIINFGAALLFLWGIAHSRGSLFNGGSLPYVTFVCVISTMLVTSLIISASMAKLSATQKSLSFLSTHDTLTGLYNRLFFETEFKRLEKSRQFPISIIMADIDKLKYINDNYGHRTGDQALVNVAKLFIQVFRQEDIVSRIGGDEFVVLLPKTDSKIAKKIIKRIRKKISSYNRKHIDLPINISMGISTANQGESLKGHLKNADKLMYEEKKKRLRK
ncbi:MAG: sensor domain-containing diguanylate cyclase [Anaerolineaceae bacterium]|nr:sensor domain-containing diguanylate cyclase [Anaerolineaceae bacterium]